MYCISCGNKLADGARFCGSCGAPVKQSNDQIQMTEVQKDKIASAIEDSLMEPLIRTMREVVQQTKTGSVRTDNIDWLIKTLEEWEKFVTQTLKRNTEQDPFVRVLRFYPLAKQV